MHGRHFNRDDIFISAIFSCSSDSELALLATSSAIKSGGMIGVAVRVIDL